MLLDNKFNIGDEVFLKTDLEQSGRLVTGLIIRAGCIIYQLSCGVSESNHYDFELTVERDILKTSTN